MKPLFVYICYAQNHGFLNCLLVGNINGYHSLKRFLLLKKSFIAFSLWQLQATEHYRQPPWLDDFQEITNLFFVVLFTFEMFLKMYSLGFQVRLYTVCMRDLDLTLEKKREDYFLVTYDYF